MITAAPASPQLPILLALLPTGGESARGGHAEEVAQCPDPAPLVAHVPPTEGLNRAVLFHPFAPHTPISTLTLPPQTLGSTIQRQEHSLLLSCLVVARSSVMFSTQAGYSRCASRARVKSRLKRVLVRCPDNKHPSSTTHGDTSMRVLPVVSTHTHHSTCAHDTLGGVDRVSMHVHPWVQ